MKKIILLAALSIAGFASAKENVEFSSKIKREVKEVSMHMFFYHPITITSSCGYTQIVEVGPLDQPDCWMTDAQQMEDDCSSPFTNPQLAGINWP